MLTLEYENAVSCHTKFTCTASAYKTVITLGAPVGEYEGRPDARHYTINVYGGSKNITVAAENEKDTYSVSFTE